MQMSRYGSVATERAFAGFNAAPRWREVVVEQDPEKWASAFPRDKHGTRLREDHAPVRLSPDSHFRISAFISRG